MHGLSVYDWPGNVRELQNAIERATALSDTEIIHLECLPPGIVAAAHAHPAPPEMHATDTTLFTLPDEPEAHANGNTNGKTVSGDLPDLKTFMREQELAYINRALTQANGDKEKAATLLGISIATLYRRLSPDE